jgi:hypothetical protein
LLFCYTGVARFLLYAPLESSSDSSSDEGAYDEGDLPTRPHRLVIMLPNNLPEGSRPRGNQYQTSEDAHVVAGPTATPPDNQGAGVEPEDEEAVGGGAIDDQEPVGAEDLEAGAVGGQVEERQGDDGGQTGRFHNYDNLLYLKTHIFFFLYRYKSVSNLL